MDVDTIDTEDLWITEPLDRQKPLHRNLQSLDRSLRCEICYRFFNNPVSLNICQHTFCSACIRYSLTEQTTRVRQGGPTCPICREPLEHREHEKNYRPNRTLAMVIAAFNAVRQPLHQTLATAVGGTATDVVVAETEERTTRRGTKRPASTGPVQLESKRRVLYNNKKKKDLQEMCRTEGISTAGTEDQLKDRHRRFLVTWNAYCDNIEGSNMTKEEIIADFNKNERERESLAATRDRVKDDLQKVYEKAHSGSNGKPKSAFETKLNAGFGALIAQCRSNKKKKQADASDSKETSTDEQSSTEESPSKQDVKVAAKAEVSEDSTPSKNESVKASSTSPELTNETVENEQMVSNPPSKEVQSVDKSDEVAVLNVDARSNQSTARTVRAPFTNRATVASKKRVTRGLTSQSITGPWTCPRCTFHNLTFISYAAKCEICHLVRPKPSSTPA